MSHEKLNMLKAIEILLSFQKLFLAFISRQKMLTKTSEKEALNYIYGNILQLCTKMFYHFQILNFKKHTHGNTWDLFIM